MKKRIGILIVAASIAAGLFAGCQSAAPERPALLSAGGDAPSKGRSQLWSETCHRCHNARSPDSYSGREWSIVMSHMRVRGYLTGEDQRAILEFLQSQ